MKYLIDFIFDTETRSRLNLKDVGAVKYCAHWSSEVLIITYCFGRHGVLKKWRVGEPIPADLMDVALHPEKYRFIAWNVAFDFLVWTLLVSRLVPGLVRPKLETVEDAMAMSTRFRTGASLEACAKFLNLGINKDPIGRKLMLKACKPDRFGNWYTLTDQEWEQFMYYAVMDTRILRDVYYMLPPLPPQERYAFEWTLRRNLRGVRLDMDLVHELTSIVQEHAPRLFAEFESITGCKLNSPVKVKEYFKAYYPWIENMQADTIREMLKDPNPVPPEVRRALEIKDMAGSTSIAKLPTMLDQELNGTVYGLYAYAYTQTLRWAGRGVQPQNFPRVDDSLDDKLDFDLNVVDLVSIVKQRRAEGLKDPIGFVKNLLRRVWLPRRERFYCGDYSKVEPSVLFWLMGLGEIPKKVYEEMASEIYGIPVHLISKEGIERQVGKAAFLSCQYGTGWEGFRDSLFKTTGILLTEEMAKQVITAYRRKFKVVADFWRDLESGFRRALRGEAVALCNGKVHIMPMQSPWKGVQIRLPSGGHLFYHNAKEELISFKEEIVELRDGRPFKYFVTKQRMALTYLEDLGGGNVGRKAIYGGLLCENVVSAIGREILVHGVWQLEDAGFDVLGVVHDEVWGDDEAGKDAEFTRRMCINPSWCDMKIDADLKVGVRYLK